MFRVSKPGSFDDLSDDDLASRFRGSSNPDYFGEIYSRHGRVVLRCCQAMVRDEDVAVDLAQDSFVRAYERMADYHGGSLRAWLLTIARNVCLNYLKTLVRRPSSLSDITEEPPLTPPADTPETRHMAASMLSITTAEQQCCLKLFYYNGYTYEEISRLTGLKLGEVKSSIQNGLGRMRRAQARAGG
ncbi:MAG: RNA polymerase sigma factor [Bryobacteraceae bacterium]